MRPVLAGAAALAVCGAAPAPSRAATTAQVKRVVDQAHADYEAQYDFKGMAVVVVRPDGDALRTHTFTYGIADSNRRQARVRPSTLFEIGSVTKVFTSALLTDAVARGVVTRTQKAQSLMPAGETLPTYQPAGPDEPPCAAEMNLQQLAGHTAGFQKALPSFASSTAEQRATFGWQQLFDEVEKEELRFCPGAGAGYSNIGVGLLGTLLAREQDTTFGALIADRVTKPLRMNSTRLEAETSRLVQGYKVSGSTAPRWMNVGAMAGGGGLMSTISDLSRFIRAHLGQGHAATVDALVATRDQIKPRRAIGWTFQETAGLDGRYYVKNGGTPGFASVVALAPGERYGVGILVNRSGVDVTRMAAAITQRLLGVTLSGDSEDDGGEG